MRHNILNKFRTNFDHFGCSVKAGATKADASTLSKCAACTVAGLGRGASWRSPRGTRQWVVELGLSSALENTSDMSVKIGENPLKATLYKKCCQNPFKQKARLVEGPSV